MKLKVQTIVDTQYSTGNKVQYADVDWHKFKLNVYVFPELLADHWIHFYS